MVNLGRVRGVWYLVGVSVGIVYRNLWKVKYKFFFGKVIGKYLVLVEREVFEVGKFI